MTQATEIDIRELTTAIDGNIKAIGVIGRSTEANAKAIEANTKAISNLNSSLTGLREEMRVGFSDVEGQITNLETKLDGKITNVESKLSGSIETPCKNTQRLSNSLPLAYYPNLARIISAVILS
jgi:hypothetical protein